MHALRFIIRHPWIVLAMALALTAASLVEIAQLRVDNSIEMWLIEGDPGLQAYYDYRQEFHNDEYIIVAYATPDGILSDRSLELSRRLTDALAEIEGIVEVKSLTTLEEIRSDDAALEVGQLIEPPLSPAERDRILTKLATDSLYKNSLASSDGKTAAIILTINRIDNPQHLERRWQTIKDIRAVLDAEPGTFHLTGGVMFQFALFHVMIHDQIVLIPMMGVIFVVALGLLFRSLLGVLVPSVTVVAAVIWTFGAIVATGYTMNVVSAILPVVLLAVGVADSVHLLSEYQEQLAHGRPKNDAITAATRSVFVPCVFTSVTTALGFCALQLIHVAPLREFGLFAAIGTMLALAATFITVPALLVIVRAPRVQLHTISDAGMSNRLTARLFRFVSAHRALMLGASVLILAVGIAGIPRIHTSANWYDYLQRDDPVIVATDFVENRIGGVYTVDVLIDTQHSAAGDEPIKSLEVLHDIEAMQARLDSVDGVEQSVSPVDFIKAMNRTLHGGDPSYETIPDSREAVGQYLLMYELDAPDGEFYDFVNFDFSRGRLTARARMSNGRGHDELIRNARSAAASFSSINAKPTGLMILYHDVEAHMLSGMLLGFSVAFVAVALMMIVLLRSLRHGLLAMIPGALPILFVVGMTGWMDTALGTMPAMMGNVALGIAVDNAIHMLTRYLRLRARGRLPAEAIGEAVAIVGRPVLFTSIVLCLGFAVLGFSGLTQSQLFGILTAIILLGSLIGSLVTLPATVLIVDELRSGGSASNADEA